MPETGRSRTIANQDRSQSQIIFEMISVPEEATAFLGVVGVFLVLLMVFYVYLNKRFCFASAGSFPCCDKPLKEHKVPAAKNLGTAYNYEEVESSTDSEDEVMQRLRHSASSQGALRRLLGHENEPESVVLGPKRICMSADKREDKSRSGHTDLISLAEKGRIGKGSSGSSFSSEEASGQEESADDDMRKLAATVVSATIDGGSAVSAIQSQQHFENAAFEKADEANSSRYAEDLVEPDEHLFDVTDLQSRMEETEATSATRCGILETVFLYDKPSRKVAVTIVQAQDLPSRDRGGANHVQVRILLLPHKRQKHKTKIRQGENPQFNECFVFNRISPEDVDSLGMRFRLYGCERMRREHLIGECILSFSTINLGQQVTVLMTLEPRSNITHSDSKTDLSSLARSDSTGSTQSMQHGGLPELLLGAAYNGTTGRLSIEVIKGSHFRNMTMNRAPDTYVKLSLVSSTGQEIARSKTSVRRGQPNPLFKETFVFQVALFQLPDVTLMVAVYNKRSMKRKEMIGWFSLGLNSSGEEELSHWNDMRENKGEQVCRWHVLLET